MGTLTPREREIATLAGGGKTNREIAAALFVTEKTVRETLRHAYAKLPPHPGVHKRIVLVRWWWREQGGGEAA